MFGFSPVLYNNKTHNSLQETLDNSMRCLLVLVREMARFVGRTITTLTLRALPLASLHYQTLQYYGTAQRQCRKRRQLFCDLRVRIECNDCVLSMRTSLDFRIL